MTGVQTCALPIWAGYAGTIMAERLASQLGQRVLVIDRRDHIAGNAYDYYDDHGVLVHKYGPHIFHTNSQKVVDYLSQFTEWIPYEHRVVAQVGDQRLPIPINRTTINQLYGLELRSDEEAREFYAFYRSLQSYERSIGKDSDLLVLTPDGEFFRYLKEAAPAGSAGAPRRR